jgi:uncharacterized protein
MDLTVLYWILIATMLVGVAGAVLPGIPGPSLILIAILVWCIATNFAIALWPLILIFIALILSAGVEWFAAYWGARQVGASNWAQFGAVLGMVLGFLGLLPALPLGGPLLGILFGAVAGAFLGEYFYRGQLEFKPRLEQALKVSVAVALGSIVGNLLEVVLAIAAIALFVWNTWPVALGSFGLT